MMNYQIIISGLLNCSTYCDSVELSRSPDCIVQLHSGIVHSDQEKMKFNVKYVKLTIFIQNSAI